MIYLPAILTITILWIITFIVFCKCKKDLKDVD
jgi:hypothetical protein